MDYKDTFDDLENKSEDIVFKEMQNMLWKNIADKVNNNRGRILDVGCGTCGIYKFINKHKIYSGIDISKKNLIEAGNRHISLRGHLWNVDAKKMKFDDNVFDNVICCEVLEHFDFDDLEKVLTEIRRVCKPNGKIVISVPNLYYLWMMIPYSLKPLKSRIGLKEYIRVLLKADVFNEKYTTMCGENMDVHYRFKPKILKNMLKECCFDIEKVETTFAYNNRAIHEIFPKLQRLIAKLSWHVPFVGAQIIVTMRNRK